MNKKLLIAPSILSADFAHLADEMRRAEAAGADWHHVDVMDGHFVPNISIGPVVVRAAKRVASLPLDVHLMIENPDQYLEAFAEAGADHILVHVEASSDIAVTLEKIKQLGCKAGVVIKPGTGVEAIEAVLPQSDIVLVMSVEPGFGGQAFMPQVLPKVRAINALIESQDLDCRIEIDGGIDEGTILAAYEAGASVFVAGSAIYRHPDGIKTGIQRLKKALP